MATLSDERLAEIREAVRLHTIREDGDRGGVVWSVAGCPFLRDGEDDEGNQLGTWVDNADVVALLDRLTATESVVAEIRRECGAVDDDDPEYPLAAKILELLEAR